MASNIVYISPFFTSPKIGVLLYVLVSCLILRYSVVISIWSLVSSRLFVCSLFNDVAVFYDK